MPATVCWSGMGRKALCVFLRVDSRVRGKNAMCLPAKGWAGWDNVSCIS